MCVKSRKTLRTSLLRPTTVYSSNNTANQDVDYERASVNTVTGKAAVHAVVTILNNTGLYNHNLLLQKTVQDSKRIVGRLAHFIMWSYKLENNIDIEPSESTVLGWFNTLGQDKYTLMLPYSNHLQDNAQKQPNTIRNYMTDIETCFAWASTFAPAELRQSNASADGIKKVSEVVRRQQSKRNRVNRSQKTWDKQVQDRKIPAGGLEELRTAVLHEVPWALAVRRSCIDDASYRRYMRVLFAALYVFSVNGRQSAVIDMKYGQAQELIEQGFATSTKFKTHSKYGYQPVTLGEVSYKLVQHYIAVVRPQVRPVAYSQSGEPLFLTYHGAPEMGVGKLVTKFFVAACGLNVSTTGIRSLVETEMHRRYKNGEINDTQRTAVQNINGHSSDITRDYYLLEDRVADVYAAKSAFEATMGENIQRLADEMCTEDATTPQSPACTQWPLVDSPPFSPLSTWSQSTPQPFTPSPLKWPPSQYAAAPRSAATAPDWGTLHPDYKSGKTTARWTVEEKSVLGSWCTAFLETHTDNNNFLAQCLKHIQSRPELVAIFHPIHTLDSARLRTGWRTYLKDMERASPSSN